MTIFHSNNREFFSYRLKEIVWTRNGKPDFYEILKTYFPNSNFYLINKVNMINENIYYWRSAMGDLHLINKMNKRHLINTLNCITGKSKRNPIPDIHFKICIPGDLDRNQWINIFIDEINKRIKDQKESQD